MPPAFEFLKTFWSAIIEPDNWRILTGSFSIIGCGVSLWINNKVGVLRRDYLVGMGLGRNIAILKSERELLNEILASKSGKLPQKEINEIFARLRPVLDTIKRTTSGPMKDHSIKLYNAICGECSFKTLGRRLPHATITRAIATKVWKLLVNLHEAMKHETNERSIRPL